MVSIIVPVYNIVGMRSFKATIKSILAQSYCDFELLLVNDGSTDASADILSNIAEKDSRIKIITKENGGVESARRAGICAAKGEFIFHMDQDDLLSGDAIEKLQRAAEENQADIGVGTNVHFFALKRIAKYPKDGEERVLSHAEFMEKYYHGFFGKSLFPVSIWNKLYRKSFLNSIEEPPRTGLYNEDFNYNIHILPEANKIVWIPDVTYYYRWGGFTCKKIKGI